MINLDIDDYLLPDQAAIVDLLKHAVNEVERSGNAVWILWIAPSGSGKSELFEILRRHNPANWEPIQPQIPFLGLEMPPSGDVASLNRYILNCLRKPLAATKGVKPLDLLLEVLKALDVNGVEVLAIEELHNALKKSSRDLKGKGEDNLKALYNAPGHRRRVLLATATNEIDNALLANPELSSRFIVFRSKRLWFSDRDAPIAFRKVALVIARRWGIEGRFAGVDKLVFVRLMFATDGHLRKLNYLLSRFATMALAEHVELGHQDTMRLLGRAFRVVIDKADSINPFDWDDEELGRRTATAREARAK